MAGLPKTIALPDGRTLPFNPEQIGRDLFAVTEQQGQPDTFLARELTDGVLHFLAELDSEEIAWSELTELVAKVVRELGRPAEAILYESSHREPPSTLNPSTDSSKGMEWYPSDLLAAHEEGLLILTDAKQPNGCAVLPIGPFGHLHPQQLSWEQVLQRGTGQVHGILAVDSPEYALERQFGAVHLLAREWIDRLVSWLHASGCRAIVNVDVSVPPVWAAESAEGSLFSAMRMAADPVRRAEFVEAIHTEAARFPEEIQFHVHRSEHVESESGVSGLATRLQAMLRHGPVEVVFDRAKQPIRLGSGLFRGDPAVLSMVGIRLPHLVRQLGMDPPDLGVIRKKLASLARFAKAAGHARRDYLRRTGPEVFHEGFFLDRAVIVVVPVGLELAARWLVGAKGDDDQVADCAAMLLTTIREAIEKDRSRIMECRIDSPWSDAWMSQFRSERSDDAESTTTLDLPSRTLLPRQQIRYAGLLHQMANGGRCCLREERDLPSEERDHLLGFALRSGIKNLRWE